MKLPGIVTNVTAFGAFIDIGVQSGRPPFGSGPAPRINPAPAVKAKPVDWLTEALNRK